MSGTRWQVLAGRAIEGIYPALHGMTDSELRLLRSAPKKATTANCWWLSHATIRGIGEVANSILANRQCKRRKAKRISEGVPE